MSPSNPDSASSRAPNDIEFPLGRLVITHNALEILNTVDVLEALHRHATGDWGDCCEEDQQANDFALHEQASLLSVYHDQAGTRFWIITEADRSLTTILLPEDY